MRPPGRSPRRHWGPANTFSSSTYRATMIAGHYTYRLLIDDKLPWEWRSVSTSIHNPVPEGIHVSRLAQLLLRPSGLPIRQF